MRRRQFIAASAGAALAAALPRPVLADAGPDDRAYFTGLVTRMADPVLAAISAGRLQAVFPLELSPIWDGRNPRVAYLECFGRLMSGLSGWLSLGPDDSDEGRTRGRLIAQAQAGYAHAVDPASPDYMLWHDEKQPLVDSAYFVQALLRARPQLWEPLDSTTQRRIVTEITQLRRVKPPNNNWLLFAAMNEAFLLSVGEAFEPEIIQRALDKMSGWYQGDGWYGDGPDLNTNYYNSYVIHPMLYQVLAVLEATGTRIAGKHMSFKTELARLQRYCVVLERLIGPDGAYPPLGRSTTYRTAVFQPLALAAWRKQLPTQLPEGQVRAALVAAHRRIFADPSNFTADGFLTLGFAGHQPGMADSYSNNGSMYIAAEGTLTLGLPPGDSFWTAPAIDWTARRAYANASFPRDEALVEK